MNSAGCIFYCPVTHRVIAGLKNNRLEGVGGKSIPDDKSLYHTALRESIEELTGLTVAHNAVSWNKLPDPQYCLVSTDGYEIYVYTYEDYASIARQITKDTGRSIPLTIQEVIQRQEGVEHRALLEVSYLANTYDYVMHDYFARDLSLLRHVLTYPSYFQVSFETTESAYVYHFEFVTDQVTVRYETYYISVDGTSKELEKFALEYVKILHD